MPRPDWQNDTADCAQLAESPGRGVKLVGRRLDRATQQIARIFCKKGGSDTLYEPLYYRESIQKALTFEGISVRAHRCSPSLVAGSPGDRSKMRFSDVG